VGEPIIPLIQFKQSECRQTDNFYNIHPYGEKHFGVREAGEERPGNSVLQGLMTMEYMTIWLGPVTDEPGYFERLTFDDCDVEGAFAWFQGVHPSKDIDLKDVWLTEGEGEDCYGGEAGMYEIWLNKSKVDGGRDFTIGDGGK